MSCCFLSSGWQPRWFVLENGVISYYDSEDDVSKGSKGSIKMSVCDIKGQTTVLKCVADDLTCPPSCCFNNNKHCSCFFISVHPTDLTRLELIIPGEQHFYVRAVNAAERQRWLVALGSSKAGTLDSHKHKGTCFTVYMNICLCTTSVCLCLKLLCEGK